MASDSSEVKLMEFGFIGRHSQAGSVANGPGNVVKETMGAPPAAKRNKVWINAYLR